MSRGREAARSGLRRSRAVLRRVATTAAAAGIAGACGATTTLEPGRVRVTVDVPETRFAAGPDGLTSVPLTVTNRGADTVGLVACGGVQVVIDRREGGRWAQGGFLCPAVYSAVPIPLAPGARYVAAAAVRGPGEYRLRVGAAPLPTRDGPDRLALPTSGTFIVE